MKLYDLEDLHNQGVLWYLNATAFHPRGYSLGLAMENGVVVGWTIVGNG